MKRLHTAQSKLKHNSENAIKQNPPCTKQEKESNIFKCFWYLVIKIRLSGKILKE